jgi:tetratricopeptide (TPR) repeat protein
VSDPWLALGYDRVATGVAETLQKSNEIAVIQGPPGVGKSWLAKGIGAMWQAGDGSAVVAEGDVLKSNASFYPFGFAMAGLSSGWRSVVPALADIAKAGETLLGTAGIITSTVQGLAALRQSGRRDRSLFLGDTEQRILYELERLSEKRPLLLIADNLHWWDARSLDFLGSLRDPRMWSAFPFLTDMRLLVAQTIEPYQNVAHPQAHDALLQPSATRTFDLPRIPRAGFERVLAALGADPEPGADITDVIYAFSGGHLALAGRCASRIAAGEAATFLAAADTDDFIRRLLSERIRSLGPMGRDIVAALQIAAVLGLTFRREELVCVSDADDHETARLLRYCRDEAVLELSDGIGRFVHDIYRQFFLNVGDEDRIAIHERLSDCLRSLRPAEYELRCLNAVSAERPREAAALAVHAAMQRTREGESWRQLPDAIVETIDATGMSDVVERFVLALEHLNDYRYDDCHDVLNMLPPDLPKSLLAEADYLRAMCLMSTRGEQDRAEGRSILRAWDGYEQQEPELGIRLTQLLLFGLTHLADKEPGRALERRLQHMLSDRAGFDVAAKDALYTLNRCAGWLDQPDSALRRTRAAVMYYGPEEDQTLVRRPLEYYRTLANYGANLICNAKYESSRSVHEQLEQMVAGYPEGVFPRLDFPRMNALLTEYRLDAVSAEDAVRRQREIIAPLNPEGDPFYADNALAVYLTLAGRFDESLEVFDRLDAELREHRIDPEHSMVYLIRANRCATWYVAGDVERARAEWSALSAVVDLIAYAIRPLLVRRHAELARVMGTGEAMSPREWDACLVGPESRQELGPLWQNFGRGFRMPEVEFWREN